MTDIEKNYPKGIATEGVLQAPVDPLAAAVQGIAKPKKFNYVAKFNDIIVGGSAGVNITMLYNAVTTDITIGGSALTEFVSAAVGKKDRTGVAVFKKRKKAIQTHTYVWDVAFLRKESIKVSGSAISEFVPYQAPAVVTNVGLEELEQWIRDYVEIERSKKVFEYVSEITIPSTKSDTVESISEFVDYRVIARNLEEEMLLLLMEDDAPYVVSTSYNQYMGKNRNRDDEEALSALGII